MVYTIKFYMVIVVVVLSHNVLNTVNTNIDLFVAI